MSKFKFSSNIYWLIHPATIALYFFIIILFFTPNYFEKYQAEILETEYGKNMYYKDLDGDEITERVFFHLNKGIQATGVSFLTVDKFSINQWNIKGKLTYQPKAFFGDYNNNHFNEIYLITTKDDSLFLNINELLLANGLEVTSRFIVKTKLQASKKNDVIPIKGVLMDINKDGNKEFVFTLFGGYSKYPRNTYAYYIKEDSLVSSSYSGAGFLSEMQYMDLNNDGVPEITGNIYASENIHDQRPYNDSSAWLMVIDPKKMDFLFPPIECAGGIASSVSPFFYHIKGEKYIVASFFPTHQQQDDNAYNLKIFDSKGLLIKEKIINNDTYQQLYFLPQRDTNDPFLYLLDRNGHFYRSDIDLNISLIQENPFNTEETSSNINLIDLDGDGKKEVLFFSHKPVPDKLIIYRSDLKDPVLLALPLSKRILSFNFSIKKTSPDSHPILVLQADDNIYHIKYGESEYHWLKYPVYLMVYLLLFLVFWLLQKAQYSIAKRRFDIEKQMMQQQLAISKKQMEPHFMLNTLNNIGYLFMKEDKKKAMYYFGKLAALMRRGLMNADKTTTSLEEEIEFVEDYLILQKQLMDGKLNYNITIDETIEDDLIQIPHSLLYTFTENAIKHGLRPKENNRKLTINITKEQQKIKISISDNGIGRQKSKELGTTDTGKGMQIVDTIILGYNKLYGGDISYQIADLLGDDGAGLGTEVVVWV